MGEILRIIVPPLLLVLGRGGVSLEGELVGEEELGEFLPFVELLVQDIEQGQTDLSLL